MVQKQVVVELSNKVCELDDALSNEFQQRCKSQMRFNDIKQNAQVSEVNAEIKLKKELENLKKELSEVQEATTKI